MKKYFLPPAIICTILIGIATLLAPKIAQAQVALPITAESLGVAYHTTLAPADAAIAQEGMIIVHRDSEFMLSTEPYDKNMYGVISNLPALEFTTGREEDTIPVISTGTVRVLVTAANGPIEVGSLITASDQPGVGMLANKTGFTLGIAQEPFNPSDQSDVGVINVNLDIKFAFAQDSPDSEKISRRLLDIVSLSTIATLEEPLVVFRYVVAGVTIIFTILASFYTFGKVAQKGIISLGRNPLASKEISYGMMINVAVSITIIVVGGLVAFMIVTI